jgi:hypothetical protein
MSGDLTINRITNMGRFLSAWDNPNVQRKAPHEPVQGGAGNINIDGSAVAPAYLLTRNDANFSAFLEPRIKALVLCLIERLDCITYSSCEGHSDDSGRLITEAHVDIIPRSEEEFQRLKAPLRDACAYAAEGIGELAPVLEEPFVESDNARVRTLEIAFRARTKAAPAYFAAVAAACERLVGWIEAITPEETASSRS